VWIAVMVCIRQATVKDGHVSICVCRSAVFFVLSLAGSAFLLGFTSCSNGEEEAHSLNRFAFVCDDRLMIC
jgi:hypothetical protein